MQLHSNEKGFDQAAWIAKSMQRAKEAFPNWMKEVRKIYGKNMIINIGERFKI